jgi:hypothetical protein
VLDELVQGFGTGIELGENPAAAAALDLAVELVGVAPPDERLLSVSARVVAIADHPNLASPVHAHAVRAVIVMMLIRTTLLWAMPSAVPSGAGALFVFGHGGYCTARRSGRLAAPWRYGPMALRKTSCGRTCPFADRVRADHPAAPPLDRCELAAGDGRTDRTL